MGKTKTILCEDGDCSECDGEVILLNVMENSHVPCECDCHGEYPKCGACGHKPGHSFSACFVNLRGDRERLHSALGLVLPLAKGYAAAHRVGSNEKHIEIAEKVRRELGFRI